MKKQTNQKTKEIVLYKAKSGPILDVYLDKDTVWLSQRQMADLFGKDVRTVNDHVGNVYKEGELSKNSTIRKFRIVRYEGKRKVFREIEHYNLDVIISVGYRVKSLQGTQFRIWATNVLKKHILEGYTINKKRLGLNYQKFMQAVADVKALLPTDDKVKARDALELINAFASTWFSLDAYDSDNLPQKGATKKQVYFTATELEQVLEKLKIKLISQKQATDLFGQSRTKEAVAGIVGNIFQSFAQKDLYPSADSKAAHLLYFMVKNHPFVDGNKRSGAFAFVWFLRKAGLLRASLTPEALTVLTLLIAESNPKDKDKMIGLVLLLLKK